MPTANGKNLSHATIVMARLGNWQCEALVDDTTKLTGVVTLEIDGQTFKGFADPVISGVFAGNAQARIYGGKGGLSKVLPAKSYVAPSLRQILTDIARECGESISTTADSGMLAKRFSKWQRESDSAIRSIESLAELAGADWRMLADGTIWIGVDAYAEQKLEHQVVNEDWARGVITIESTKPELRPGVTFKGLRIEEVVHRLTPQGIRTDACATSLAGHFRRLLGETNRKIDFSRLYPARVARQNPDNSLQVVFDDAVMKSGGIDKIPIRNGLPATVKVSNGARVIVAFEAGSPSRPFVCAWENSAVLEIALADGVQRVARQSDLVMSGGAGTIVNLMPLTGLGAPPNNAVVAGVPHMISFSAIPPTPVLASPLYGVISTGSPKVKA